MSGGQLNVTDGGYQSANAGNMPPPPITSDPLVTGATPPIEQLLRVLGLAANLGDPPKDNTESAEEHAKRDSKTAEAAAKFPPPRTSKPAPR